MAASAGFDDDDEVISAINVTPLVDVTLVLLIIFMVTATYIVANSIPVDLPEAWSYVFLQTETTEGRKDGGENFLADTYPKTPEEVHITIGIFVRNQLPQDMCRPRVEFMALVRERVKQGHALFLNRIVHQHLVVYCGEPGEKLLLLADHDHVVELEKPFHGPREIDLGELDQVLVGHLALGHWYFEVIDDEVLFKPIIDRRPPSPDVAQEHHADALPELP